MWFQRTFSLPIGLHVGFDAVRLLQLRRTADGPLAIQAAASAPLPLDEKADVMDRITAAGGAIQTLLKHGGFRGRAVTAALPRDLVHLRTLRLPPMPDADVAWAVQADARDVFLFDTSQARIQFIDAGEVRQGGEIGREVILMAAGTALIDEFIARLDTAGAETCSLDIEPCALHRALRAGRAGVHALVQVGDTRSHIVVANGDRIRVIRTLEIGSVHFRRATDAARGFAETIVRETSLALRQHAAAFRGAQPDRLWTLGAETTTEPFQLALKAAALPPPMAVDPFMGLDATALQRPADQWTVALGLALRALHRGKPSVVPSSAETSAAM